MKGRRIYPDSNGLLKFRVGDYGKKTDGTWAACTPSFELGDLTDHTVVEHEDRTISVSPSIMTDKYHGFLRAGDWIP